jgi:hypothetical protein
MPAYVAGSPTQLSYGQVFTVWNGEQPAPGGGGASASSAAFLLALSTKSGTPFGVDIKFAADPGVFEIDIQVAAVDSDTNYQTVQNGVVNAVDPTNHTYHFDFFGTARFARLLMRTRTNAVNVTASLTGG